MGILKEKHLYNFVRFWMCCLKGGILPKYIVIEEIKNDIFSLLMKTKLLQSIDEWRKRGEYQQNPFRRPRRPLRPFINMPNNYFFFIFHFFPRKLKLFTLFNADQNHSNLASRLSLAVD